MNLLLKYCWRLAAPTKQTAKHTPQYCLADLTSNSIGHATRCLPEYGIDNACHSVVFACAGFFFLAFHFRFLPGLFLFGHFGFPLGKRGFSLFHIGAAGKDFVSAFPVNNLVVNSGKRRRGEYSRPLLFACRPNLPFRWKHKGPLHNLRRSVGVQE